MRMKQKKPKYLDEAFSLVTQEMLETFIKKHKDYGKGNILDIGELGIAFRISEKVSRLKHLLAKKDKPENESIDDCWLDIAVYGAIALLFRRKWFQKLNLKK